jgi:hypothetical protein
MKYRMYNDFHNTTADILLKDNWNTGPGKYQVSKRAAKQAWKKLCGYKECTCGDTFGARPADLEIYNPWEPNQDYWAVDLPEYAR